MYERKQHIKKIIWELKKKFEDDLVIVTTGQNNNVDKYVKDFCSLFEIKYEEVVRFDGKWNNFCVHQPYMYNKLPSKRWFHINNNKFAGYCDVFLVFKQKDDKTRMYITDHLKLKKKKYVIYD